MRKAGMAGFSALAMPLIFRRQEAGEQKKHPFTEGLCLSTWNFGLEANKAARDSYLRGESALEMAESAAMQAESDRGNLSVGLSGYPDRDGHTTLDACIMDFGGRAGSVTFLEGFEHPVSVARRIMELTPHVMLTGAGAKLFALQQGFVPLDYRNPDAVKAWEKWKEERRYQPVINIENHDTIGVLAMDAEARISGACTTSGLAFKMHGRVGDSPIIGAGLYVDNEVGAATATGLGEAVLRSCSSFLVVELMRRGLHPQQACEEAIRRLVRINSFLSEEYQVGLLAVDKSGRTGAFSVRPGFSYALWKAEKNEVHTSASHHPK